jgi:branched-chain amino acid transport system permease protein
VDFSIIFSDFWSLTIDGFVVGAIIALVSLGYTLVYGVLRLINFAHSEIFMIGTMTCYVVIQQFGFTGYEESVPVWKFASLFLLFSLTAAIVSGVAAVILEIVAYRRLRVLGASRLSSLISAIGASFFLVEVARKLSDSKNLDFPRLINKDPFLTLSGYELTIAKIGLIVLVSVPLGFVFRAFKVRTLLSAISGLVTSAVLIALIVLPNFNFTIPGSKSLRIVKWLNDPLVTSSDAYFTADRILVTFGAAIIFFILNRVINHTKLGLGIRAVSQDERTSILMGVNVNRIISYTFLLGGVLAGLGSAFYMVFYETTKANVGFLIGISAFTAAVLGGIGNVKGALYGSFALGLFQQYTSAVLGYNWKDVVTFIILVFVLLVKPTGLFGEALQKARV